MAVEFANLNKARVMETWEDGKTYYRTPKPFEPAKFEGVALTTAYQKIRVEKDHKAILVATGAGNITFKNGDNPDGKGEITVASTETGVFFPIESARITDRDGLISVKASTTGIKLYVLEVR